jgi:hypothetical protein
MTTWRGLSGRPLLKRVGGPRPVRSCARTGGAKVTSAPTPLGPCVFSAASSASAHYMPLRPVRTGGHPSRRRSTRRGLRCRPSGNRGGGWSRPGYSSDGRAASRPCQQRRSSQQAPFSGTTCLRRRSALVSPAGAPSGLEVGRCTGTGSRRRAGHRVSGHRVSGPLEKRARGPNGPGLYPGVKGSGIERQAQCAES